MKPATFAARSYSSCEGIITHGANDRVDEPTTCLVASSYSIDFIGVVQSDGAKAGSPTGKSSVMGSFERSRRDEEV